jgi:hypothetical protein
VNPTEAEAARIGLTLEEATPPPFEVWPEHMAACDVLVSMQTQWDRAGMAGVPTGLKYPSLIAVMSLLGIPHKERRDVFSDLRVMELAVLEMKH